MGKIKGQSETITSMVLDNTEDEQPNDNESVEYFYEIMKAEDQNQILLEEEVTGEDDDNGNNCELNRLNTLSQELKQVIVKHNLSTQAANDIVQALNNYGFNLQQNSLINEIQKALTDIKTDIRDIKNYLFYTQNEFVIKLPINGGLEDFNDKLNREPAFVNYFRKMIKIYKPIKGKCPNTYGLSKTFSDSLLAEYNWDGSHGRKSFQNFKTLNRVLFDAWGGDETFDTFANYTKSIRSQFTTARIRRHKRVIAAKAKQLEESTDE